MPFDFIALQHYSISYTDLFNEINSHKILDDSNIQTEYLLLWMNKLYDLDKFITGQLSTEKSIKEMQMKLGPQREIFQSEINFNCARILLHFRVSFANQIIAPYKSQSQHIPVEEFLKKDSEFKWTPVDTNISSYSSATDPIIIVPFLNKQHKYLIIDGNHRLTYKTQNNTGNVEAIIISEQTVLDFSLFSSGFDKYYYIMNNEIDRMAYQTKHSGAKAYDLVQKSYLKEGILQLC